MKLKKFYKSFKQVSQNYQSDHDILSLIKNLEQQLSDINILYKTSIQHNTQMENDLLAKKTCFQSIFHHTSDLICIISRDRIIYDANNSFCHYFKYEKEQICKRFITEIFNLRTDKRVLDFIESSFKNISHVNETLFLHNKTHLRCLSQKIYDKKQIQYIIFTFKDVTAEIKQNQLINKQAAFLNKVSDCIMMFDFQGKIVFWNPSCINTYGWSEEEIVGKNINDVLYMSEQQESFKKSLHQFKKNHEWVGEVTHHSKKDERLFFISNWSLFQNQKDESPLF